MTLEERIAYWVDAGVTPYQEVEALQVALVSLRAQDKIPDVIIATQHHPEVNFGGAQKDNQFSVALLEEVIRERNLTCALDGVPLETVREVLKEKGYNFSKSSRGGGATVYSPGQLVYYPVVEHTEITGKAGQTGLPDYKQAIYSIMFQALQRLGVSDINVVSAVRTRGERRDAWIQRNGVTLKMGSKGIIFGKKVAYQGFALYVDQKCVEPFSLVHPCGFTKSEVKIHSLQEELERKVNHAGVHREVRRQIERVFNYQRTEDLSYDVLKRKVCSE